MLILTRKAGQKIMIGDNIVVCVKGVSSQGNVSLGIEAPPSVEIDREEIRIRKIQEREMTEKGF